MCCRRPCVVLVNIRPLVLNYIDHIKKKTSFGYVHEHAINTK